jgi:hypothetical protein
VRSGAAPISFNLVSGTVELLAGSGGNTIDITGTTPGVSVVVDVCAGGDAVNVGGPANTLDSIQGLLSIHGQGGNTTLNVHDDGNSVSENYTVSPTTIQRSIIVAGVYNFNIATITYYTVGHVNVYVGSAQMGVNQGALDYNTLDVVGTMAGTVTDLYGNNNGGQTAFAAYPYVFNYAGPILGDVHFHASSIGLDTVGYVDYFGPGGQTYTMTAGQMIDTGFAPVTYDGNLYGVGLETSVLGGSKVNVLSTAAVGYATGVNVNVGDTVTVGSQAPNLGGNLAGLAAIGRLSIQSIYPKSAASVILDDETDTQVGKQVTFSTVSSVWEINGLAPQLIALTLSAGSNVQVLGSSPAAGLAGSNAYAIQSVPAGISVGLKAGTGGDVFLVGSTANTLDLIQGPVTVNGIAGSTSMTVNDQGTTTAQNWDVANSWIDRFPAGGSRPAVPQITYHNLATVTVNTGTGQSFISVLSTTAGTNTMVNANCGGDEIFVENSADMLDDIQGPVHVHDVAPGDLLIIDQLNTVGHTYTLTAGEVQRDGIQPITYDNMGQVVVATANNPYSGHTPNTVNVQSLGPDVFAVVEVGTADSVTVGQNGVLASILGDIRIQSVLGQVPRQVTLDDSSDTNPHTITLGSAPTFGYLVNGLLPPSSVGRGRIGLLLDPNTPVSILGGPADDVFRVQDFAGAPALSLVAEPATSTRTNRHNKLDYSAYTGTVKVVLPLGYATGFVGISGIQDVTGGIGNSLLVGDAAPNILVGGTGRNVIIGGAGADTLDASGATGDNILIGGTTDFDSNLAALNAIFAEWTRTDLSFRDRFSDLTTGTNGQNATPLNQVNGQLMLLTSSTVHADSSPDQLIGSNLTDPATGQRVHNWFFVDADDTVANYLSSSDHKTKVK